MHAKWMVVMVMAGCAPPLAGVRLKAAAVLQCPNDRVSLEQQQGSDWKAAGCGRRIELRCPGGDSGANCQPTTPTPWLATISPNDAPSAARIAVAPAPAQHADSATLHPPGNVYMPGQFNQRTGAVQTDYAHQYTAPAAAQPQFHPYTGSPAPAYHPYTPPPSYHH